MEISTYASNVVEFRSHRLRRGLNSPLRNGLARRHSEFLTHTSHRLWRNNLDCWKRKVPYLQIKVCPKDQSIGSCYSREKTSWFQLVNWLIRLFLTSVNVLKNMRKSPQSVFLLVRAAPMSRPIPL
jgi:hypothetical protein